MRKAAKALQGALCLLIGAVTLLNGLGGLFLDFKPRYVSILVALAVALLGFGLLMRHWLARRITAAAILLMALTLPFAPLLEHSRTPPDLAHVLMYALPIMALMLLVAYVLDYKDRDEAPSAEAAPP